MDALGNPIHVHLTAGNCHDATQAQDALSSVPVEGGIVLADKAYGSKDIRKYIASRDATYCIPPKSNEKSPWPCDWWQYKERHLVECFFQKLKQFRRIASRFDKLARRFLAFVHLGCILIWLA